MDHDGDMVADGPEKRTRVAFDPDVQVQVMSSWEKGLDLVREEVRTALERRGAGDNTGYDAIKQVFTTPATAQDPPSPKTVTNHVLALTSNVSRLNKSCSGLVHAILGGDWLGRDDAFVSLYVQFLGNLVSAQGGYVDAVLAMLVGNLVSLPASTGRLPEFPLVRRPQLHARTHMALKYLLQLVPSASSVLSPILSSNFPHSSDSKRAHTEYIENLLRLVGYAPELKSETLALITDRLVKIDIQVQIDMEDLEEEVGDGLVQEVSRHLEGEVNRSHSGSDDDDDDNDDDDDVHSVSSHGSLDEEARRLREVTASVQKMDAIMDILFRFHEPSYLVPSSIESQSAFRLLLNHFAVIILPTYRSRHTQFLLFHFAQTSPLLMDEFVGACAHLAFEQGRPTILKQSSAAYLASFIARGAHVPTQIVQDAFNVLGDHLDLVRAKEEPSCRGPDLRRYGTYYAMVQALLYIFCFRWRDLLASPEDYVEEDDAALFDSTAFVWAPGIRDILTRTIYSKFNPLKVCSPSIVNEFARIAHHLRFMYVYPLIETNKRLRLSQRVGAAQSRTCGGETDRQTALTARKDEEYQLLDAYFPFDPYHLPISKRWIAGDYVDWRGIPGLDDKREGANSETGEEEDAATADAIDDGTETGDEST
ncbi:MAG: hypothetical protein M1832_001763 [Thelocarpon impressellum]|nr:MAG: hypothetical protein M1832_001763 [Thelocarpon impressellum]